MNKRCELGVCEPTCKNLHLKGKKVKILSQSTLQQKLSTLEKERDAFRKKYKDLVAKQIKRLDDEKIANKRKGDCEKLQVKYDELKTKYKALLDDRENWDMRYDAMLCVKDSSFEEKESNFNSDVVQLQEKMKTEQFASEKKCRKELYQTMSQLEDVMIKNSHLRSENARIRSRKDTKPSELMFYDQKIKKMQDELSNVRKAIDNFKSGQSNND